MKVIDLIDLIAQNDDLYQFVYIDDPSLLEAHRILKFDKSEGIYIYAVDGDRFEPILDEFHLNHTVIPLTGLTKILNTEYGYLVNAINHALDILNSKAIIPDYKLIEETIDYLNDVLHKGVYSEIKGDSDE